MDKVTKTGANLEKNESPKRTRKTTTNASSDASKRRRPRRKAASKATLLEVAADEEKKKKAATTNNADKATPSPNNKSAEIWGQRLQQAPTYLTPDGQSWYILVKKWMPTPSPQAFEQEWELHPSKRHVLKVYGREAEESRWSQSWGVNYAYSGAVNLSRPLSESTVLPVLLEKIHNLLDEKENPYNGCLQNWYTPNDKIGLHSDDERSLIQEYPIWSLSWGGTRRFLFRRKVSKKKQQRLPPSPEKPVEVWLENGDLILMGGTCQLTHKHEIPKPRKRDPSTSNRINWTIRAFR